MDKVTHKMRLTHWTTLIRDCSNSGMSKKAWCLENNISEKQFYYWQRQIRKKAYNELSQLPDQERFVELKAPTMPSTSPVPPVPDMVLRVGNCVLEINNSASTTLLQSLLKVLSHVQ